MTLIDWLSDPHAWASFITLSAMEIVLGIDNVVCRAWRPSSG